MNSFAMNSFDVQNQAWWPQRLLILLRFPRLLRAYALGLWPACFLAFISASISPCFGETNTGALFAPPAAQTQAQDDIWLISTRQIGTTCTNQAMQRGLDCRTLVKDSQGEPAWKTADWRELTEPARACQTIIYVHGNRVVSGYDRVEGLNVYRSFQKHRTFAGPVRFIIWSWPSEQISRPIKDYLVKAQRTNPVAWQMAWFLDKLPNETPLSMVGYSYGTRVICGASHLLAGGRIGPLKLGKRLHANRPPARAALMAAAFDANWLQPGKFYSRTMSKLEHVVLGTNKLDPAMRFYHLSNGRGHMDALGKFGLHKPRTLGAALSRVRRIDYTQAVGRSHVIDDYLNAGSQMQAMWRELMGNRPRNVPPIVNKTPASPLLSNL